MKQTLLILSFFVLTLVSCSKDSDTTGGNNNNNNNGTNNAPKDTMIVTVDGTAYTFTAAGATNGGITTVAGGDASGRTVGFNLQNITGPGTYSVGLTGGVTLTYSYMNGSESIAYSTLVLSGGGTVTVQELTDSTCKATFNGTVTKISGSGGAGSAVITNGSVNARLAH